MDCKYIEHEKMELTVLVNEMEARLPQVEREHMEIIISMLDDLAPHFLKSRAILTGFVLATLGQMSTSIERKVLEQLHEWCPSALNR